MSDNQNEYTLLTEEANFVGVRVTDHAEKNSHEVFHVRTKNNCLTFCTTRFFDRARSVKANIPFLHVGPAVPYLDNGKPHWVRDQRSWYPYILLQGVSADTAIELLRDAEAKAEEERRKVRAVTHVAIKGFVL